MPVDQSQAPRNCISCKERKVRCDRRRPCLNCTKANRECVFPTTGRILRQPQRVRRDNLANSGGQVDLMDRIHRLENIVGRLRATTDSSQAWHHDLAGSEISLTNEDQGSICDINSSSATGSHRANGSSEIGVMVGQERGGLYVGDDFWADLQQELDTIKQNINEASHEDDDADSDYSPSLQSSHRTISSGTSSFIFSNRFMSTRGTEDLKPLPSQMLFIWQTFIENVDPFIKVLHVPTVSKMIHDSRGNFDLLPPSMEPLMSSIAFAAIKSLTAEEVQIHFRSNKKDLMSRFRLGTEDALSRADFINTKELSVVQALLVYTLLIRLEESQRYVWALTGLISRIAMAIGLHRDGSHFPGISPFEAEMRRRSWCYIRIFDFATGDFQVPEISISNAISNTEIPLNLNDEDIQPEMSVLPEVREGHTDTSICLLRCKIWRVGKHFKDATSSMYPCRQEPDADTLCQLEKLSVFSKDAFSEFLTPSQPDKPIYLFTRTMAAIAVRRYELILEHIRQPSLQLGKGRLDTDKPFKLALGILEDIHMLQRGPSTRRWAWQLDGFMQWQPLVLVLSRLSVVEFDEMAEHAWSMVTRNLEACPASIREEPLWQPLFNVIQSVKKRRLQQLKRRPGPEPMATRTSPPTEHPSLGWTSQPLFLARINDSDAHVGDMEAISSVYQREEGHLPVEPGQSAQGSLPEPQDQNTGDGSLQHINNPGWDEWTTMMNMSEQSMLWDRWAF